jgi:hypothetical protein
LQAGNAFSDKFLSFVDSSAENLFEWFLQFDTNLLRDSDFLEEIVFYRQIIIVISSDKNTAYNFSLRSSPAALGFGVHLSVRAAFRLDRKSPAVRPCV